MQQADTKKTQPSVSAELKRLLPTPAVQLAWLVLAVVFVWFHWGSIERLVHTWSTQEDYGHGFFVPLFSLFLLWHRRDMIAESSEQGSWWGLAFLGFWAVLRLAAVYFNYGTLPELSLIPFFAGVALFVGGWQALLWAWPSVLFLIFMIPLPGTVQFYLSEQLQALATRLSVYIVQTIGIAAVAQGNVIQLTNEQLEVARACSGLRMMMLFFAICIGAAFIARKPLWERLLMVASALPIAVISNVVRIVATAILFELGVQWPSHEQIHNWAGFAMMPVGLLLLLAEMTILTMLLVEPVSARPLSLGRAVAADRSSQGAVERTLVRRRR